ncbi:MAG: TraR/DksA C4-type zinc finger protein [Kiritimatiellae bacterium]|nr:TraR/DksA C4-type zinc finger protein [Kiritimatiellia bacterium]
MSTKTKKAATKPAVKAGGAKKPASKKPVTKKPVTKKPSPAKAKPAVKKPAVKKAPAQPAVKKATQPTTKKEAAHKPITVVKKTVRPPLKKPEEPTAFENQSRAFAFSFAEMMKKQHRESEEQKKAETKAIKLSRRPTTRAKGKNTQQFPEADLAEFRKRLILLRQEALGQSATLRTNALEQTDERGSEDEDGSDAFMRLQNLSQVDSQNKVIQKIDEALHRIAEGTYGICEVCGQLIRKPRLMNLPFVHTCMECQSEMENHLR